MAEKINNIRTMSQDLINLKKKSEGASYREMTKIEKTQADKRLRIEEQIKREKEEQIKREEEELLRARKAERLKEIEEEKKKEEKPEPQLEVKEDPIKVVEPVKIVKPIPIPIKPEPVVVEKKPVKKITDKEALLLEKENIKNEKKKIKDELIKLQEQKDPLVAERNIVSSRLVEVKKGFGLIAVKEQKIEKLQKDLEEKTLIAKTADQRKNLEKQRWGIEEKRRDLEKKRWPWDEKLKGITVKLESVDKKSADIDAKERELNDKYAKSNKEEDNIDLKLRKIELSGILSDTKGLRDSFSKKRVEIGLDINKIKVRLNEVLGQDKKINEEKQVIEQKESGEQNSTQKRELEKQRWTIEEQRRNIETKRWQLDEEKERLENHLSKIEGRLESVSAKEKAILSEISGIDEELGENPKQDFKQEPKEELKKEELKEQSEETLSEEFIDQKKKDIIPEAVPDEKKQNIEDARKRLQILKQASVSESQKEDLMEADSEPTPRMAPKMEPRPEPKPEPKPQPKVEVEPMGEHKENLNEGERRRADLLDRMRSPLSVVQKKSAPLEPEEFVKRVPKKPSKEKKIWLRIVIVAFVLIILTAVVTFWYWYFGVRNEYKIEDINQEQPGGSDNPGGTEEPGESFFSTSLFSVDDTRVLSINNLDEIPPLLSQILGEAEVDNKYTRIIIKKSDKEIGLLEFNQALSVRMPDSFYSKVEDIFTLFTYSQPQGNRLGLVAKVSDSNELSSILKNQEGTMEEDFKPLFELVGQTKPGVVSYFRTASNVKGYEGPDFRYQTINTNDIGICYASMNNYFVLSSSWRSMERLLNKLEIAPPKQELTMELKLGDKNEEVKTLQTWLAKDVQVYPKAIITGYYGSLTKQAVIKFQEKYASEILAPQGLEAGTGIVDPFTINKLNELYATP